MKSRINKEEREISISEIWWYVISKWKWLVIGMIVGALLFGAYGVYSIYKAKVKSKENILTEYTMDDLTQEEQETIKELLEDRDEYMQELEMLENNYLMNLDYNSATYYMVTYYVDTDYSYNYLDIQEDYTQTLISIYKTYICGDEVCEGIIELGIEGLEKIDLAYIYGVHNEGNIVRITVYADEEYAEIIIDKLCEKFEEYYAVATELVGEHKLVKLSKDARISHSDSIVAGQNYKNSIAYTLYSDMEMKSALLNEKQVYVYTKMANKENEDVSTVVNEGDGTNGVHIKKYIAIGAVGGMILAVVIAFAVYIFGKSIKSVREISQVYSLEIIGKILSDEMSNRTAIKKINGINKTKTEVEQKIYVAETIINKCKNENISEIIFCSTVENMEGKLSEVVNCLKKGGVNCRVINNINCDSNALSSAMECKNVIIAEHLNEVRRDDLEEEIEVCDKLSINILGMIVII